jgi:hypothetical protein
MAACVYRGCKPASSLTIAGLSSKFAIEIKRAAARIIFTDYWKRAITLGFNSCKLSRVGEILECAAGVPGLQYPTTEGAHRAPQMLCGWLFGARLAVLRIRTHFADCIQGESLKSMGARDEQYDTFS